MSHRTWLTTPSGHTPATGARPTGAERYVPGPDLPTEPRVPAPRRGLALLIVLATVTLLVIAGMILAGDQGQRHDPAAPRPGEGTGEPGPLELPEA